MKKQEYVLLFPLGMNGEKTIRLSLNPLMVKDVVKQIIESQSMVFGEACIIQDIHSNVIGISYQGETGGVRFYTEDDDVERIKETEDF